MAEWDVEEVHPDGRVAGLREFSVTPRDHLGDLIVAMESVAPALEEVLRERLEDGVFRVKLHAAVSMRRGDEVEDKTFHTGNIQRGVLIPVFTAADIPERVMAMTVQVLVGFEEFEGRGSGWILEHVVGVTVRTVAFEPLQRTAYSTNSISDSEISDSSRQRRALRRARVRSSRRRLTQPLSQARHR